MAIPGPPEENVDLSSLAGKINFLFETIRRPDGTRHSNDEVAAAMPAKISGSYLWLLRRGDRENPTKRHLEALAGFFDVSPAFFFDEQQSAAIAGELTLLRSLAGADVTRVATRLGGLSHDSLLAIADVIERFRASEGLDAQVDKPEPGNRPRRRPIENERDIHRS